MKPKVSSIVVRAAIVATVAAVLFAMSGTADGEVINPASRKGMSGKLNITVPTEAGGTLLPPGSYEVEVRKSGGGSVVEFARWTYNPYAQESLPVWDREVVATVNAIPQEMNSAATRTELLLASSGSNRALALEIRGHSVDYVF
ncbi:MAG: hypothetical protein LAO06_03500 [Acidobacteriia bacterium]|nr:hypothetical protein [Terriglobia bacterium]